MSKQERLDAANALLVVIASCGRHFFRYSGTVSKFELDARGRVWFVDAYRGARVYTHYVMGRWHGFSEGGTLRELVIRLRDYITKGRDLGRALGPFPDWYSGGDPWGYNADMKVVFEKACELGIVIVDAPIVIPDLMFAIKLRGAAIDGVQWCGSDYPKLGCCDYHLVSEEMRTAVILSAGGAG